MTESRQLFLGKKAFFTKNGIKQRRSVSLAEDKAVTVNGTEVIRVDVHLIKVQRRHDVSGAQAAAGMAALCGMDLRQDVLSDIQCVSFQFYIFHILSPHCVIS